MVGRMEGVRREEDGKGGSSSGGADGREKREMGNEGECMGGEYIIEIHYAIPF